MARLPAPLSPLLLVALLAPSARWELLEKLRDDLQRSGRSPASSCRPYIPAGFQGGRSRRAATCRSGCPTACVGTMSSRRPRASCSAATRFTSGTKTNPGGRHYQIEA